MLSLKIIEKVRESAMRLKPIAEKRTGLKLDNISVKTSSRDKKSPLQYLPPNLILVNLNSIYLNCKFGGYFKNSLFNPILRSKVLDSYVAHELGHHVHYTLNPTSFTKLEKNYKTWIEENKNDTNTLLVQHFLRDSPVLMEIDYLETIMEGFAEYFALDLFPSPGNSLLNILINRKRRQQLLQKSNRSYYAQGYRVFNEITKQLGEKEAFDSVKSLDVTLEELENPELYIERRRK